MAKKRFFTKNNERVGKKSGKPRGKYQKHSKHEEIVPIMSVAQVLPESKSPNISQNITEESSRRFPVKAILACIGGCILLGLSLWQVIGLGEQSLQLKTVVSKRISLSQQMQLWENIGKEYPGYRDAFFQAAVLAYRLGDREKEKTYLDKVLAIDPNYLPAKNLAKLTSQN